MQNYLDLTGKTALITGASSGIGAAAAAIFADLGARVAIGYHNNEKGAYQVRDAVAATGAKIIAIKGDVRLVHTGAQNADLIINPSPVAQPYQQNYNLVNLGVALSF